MHQTKNNSVLSKWIIPQRGPETYLHHVNDIRKTAQQKGLSCEHYCCSASKSPLQSLVLVLSGHIYQILHLHGGGWGVFKLMLTFKYGKCRVSAGHPRGEKCILLGYKPVTGMALLLYH